MKDTRKWKWDEVLGYYLWLYRPFILPKKKKKKKKKKKIQSLTIRVSGWYMEEKISNLLILLQDPLKEQTNKVIR